MHCVVGSSRSASIVIAFLMKKINLDFNQALEYVQSIRNIVNPNHGFVKQLRKYELELNQDSKLVE